MNARDPIDFKHVGDRDWSWKVPFLQRPFDQPGNIGERDVAGEEARHGGFVRGVEHDRRSAARFERFPREPKRWK